MNKNKSEFYNRTIYIVISFVIALFGLITIFLGTYSQKNDQYTFYTSDLTNKIYINEIRFGDSILKLYNFNYKGSKYNSKSNKITLSKGNNYFLKKSKIDNLKISFENKGETREKIYVKKNNQKLKQININKNSSFVYMDNQSTFSIIKSEIFKLTKIQIFLFFSLFVALSFIIYYCLCFICKFIDNLLNNKFSIFKFIISIVMLFFVNLLYIFPLSQFFKYIAILPMITALTFIIIKVAKNRNVSLQNCYLIISMFIGILFIFIFPPLHVPDETSHMIKSYQNSYIFEKNHEITKDATYAYLPKNMNKFITKYGDQTLNYDYRLQARTYTYDLFRLNNYNDLSNSYTWYSLKYTSSVPYFPGTIMALIAKITKMPVLLFYYFSKLFNYIISVLMCYYAIKIAPKFKKIFFLVPLLPIFIQQSFGFNVDWLTNSTFILLLAFIIKGIYSIEKMRKKDYIMMLLLSILLGFCKFGYFPIALLFVLIPFKKSNMSVRKKRIYMSVILIISVLLPILVTVLNNTIASQAYTSAATSSRNTIPISTLYTNPRMILSMLKETFKLRLDLDFFRGLVTGFGWSTIWSNSLLLFISLVILMSVILCKDKDNTKLDKKQKSIFILAFTMICGLIYAAMLFAWSEMGSTSIDGLQPRYFIPPIMLLYILLQNDYVTINFKNRYLFYSLSMILINVLSLITILERVYL